jgi:hypothetical protein
MPGTVSRPHSGAVVRVLLAAVSALLVAGDLPAQTLREQCARDAASAQTREFCGYVADAAVIIQPRAGIAMSGGNPVPGSASTMGMRLGSLPRVSLGLRVTAASVGLPPVESVGGTSDITFPVGSIAIDGSVGIYPGLSLLPTVGGFGALDLLGSVGIMPLPTGEGFDIGSAGTWALGARVGVLRESFTAPGLSIDVIYRSIGEVAYGSADLADRDAFIRVAGYRATSLRGTVGKRLLGFGLTGGVARDWYRADVSARVRDASIADPSRVLELRQTGLSTSRTAVFGNASLTMLILNLAAELGWQQGGPAVEGASDRLEKGGLFGGIAVRVAI